MTPGTSFPWLESQVIVVFLLGVGLTVLGIIFRAKVMDLVANKADASTLASLGGRVDLVERRIVAVETALPHVPTDDEIRGLELAVEAIRGEIKANAATMGGISELLRAMSRRLELIDEHLKARPLP